MISKFEAVGLVVSVGVMVVVLYVLNNGTAEHLFDGQPAPSSAATSVVTTSETDGASLSDVLSQSLDRRGTLQNMIVDDITEGFGDEVQEGDTVVVHYIGTLRNGQQFDNTYTDNMPFTFTLGKGEVIEGWDAGLVGMKVGGQRILVVPPSLAYKEEGFGPIPPNATLVFAVELVEILDE